MLNTGINLNSVEGELFSHFSYSTMDVLRVADGWSDSRVEVIFDIRGGSWFIEDNEHIINTMINEIKYVEECEDSITGWCSPEKENKKSREIIKKLEDLKRKGKMLGHMVCKKCGSLYYTASHESIKNKECDECGGQLKSISVKEYKERRKENDRRC